MIRRATVALVLATMAATAKPPRPATRPATADAGATVNQAVLKYAAAQVGKKVGNGECWTLAAEALKAAGAKHAKRVHLRPQAGQDGDPVQPGDVMQFTSCQVQGGRCHSGTGGRWSVSLGFPNHTAVVKAVISPTKYKILQQNPGPVERRRRSTSRTSRAARTRSGGLRPSPGRPSRDRWDRRLSRRNQPSRRSERWASIPGAIVMVFARRVGVVVVALLAGCAAPPPTAVDRHAELLKLAAGEAGQIADPDRPPASGS